MRSHPTATPEEVEGAIDRSARLLEQLREECGGNVEHACFVLCTTLRLLHLIAESDLRARLEEHARSLLAEMYAAPPRAQVTDGKIPVAFVVTVTRKDAAAP